MLYVKRVLLLLLIALLGVFAFQNQEHLGASITLTFLKWQQTLVLGFWLLLSFLSGALLFILVDMLRSFSLKRELARKSQELARVQYQLTHAQAHIDSLNGSAGAAPQAAGRPATPPAQPGQPPSPPIPRPPAPPQGDLEQRLGL